MSKVVNLLLKDIVSEARSSQIVLSVLFFAVMVVVVFSFALEADEDTMQRAAPGVLWVAFTFAGVLGLNHIFASERANSCLEGLMLCPISRDAIYWGKAAAAFVFMMLVELVVTPILLIFFDLPFFVPELALICLLATVGFVSVGTLFSAMAVKTRARDILLPILFFPVVIPVIICAVEATRVAFDGEAFSEMVTWLEIMLAFDVIFLVVSSLVFEFVVEE